MGKITRFFFEKDNKKLFPPFRSKRANLLVYVASVALATVFSITDLKGYEAYQRAMERYRAGEITAEPQPSDYGFLGQLEKWLSKEEK